MTRPYLCERGVHKESAVRLQPETTSSEPAQPTSNGLTSQSRLLNGAASNAPRSLSDRGQRNAVEAEPSGQILPLSVAQRGLWVGQKIGRTGAVFNIAEAIEIHGPVDPGLFRDALRQLTGEVETIRAKIIEGPEGPRQIVRPTFDDEIPFFDVSAEEGPRQTAEDWMMQELSRPVDFECDPLWVSALFKAAPDRFFWYHRGHHIIMDGFSGGMAARRVAEIYTALTEGGTPPPHQFGALATLIENEAAYRASERFARDREYWRDRLANLPEAVSLAKRRVSGLTGLFRKTAHLSPASTRRLREIAKGAAGSLPQILISLAAAFIYRTTGAEDLVFGLPVTARPNGQLRRIPGMVANAVPIRLAMSPKLTLDELIRQVASTVRQALRHQQYRYEDLRRDFGLVGPHQQISWLGVNIEPFDYDLRFGGYPATTHNLSNGSIEDLTIFIYDRDDGQGLRVDFDASPALYTAEELAEHQTRFLRLIDAILEQPDQRIGEVDLLDPQERRQLLVGWNDTTAPLPEGLLVEQFEEHVRVNPHAVAVEFEDARLTYQELNAEANFWAHALIEIGVGPGDLVGIALPRTMIMPVAIMAILKAGAAYLPIDPDHPADRLAKVLEDARPAAVLTTMKMAPDLPLHAATTIFLDRPWGGIDSDYYSDRNPTNGDRLKPLTQADTAYVIFTSGSTGRPKGVVIPHHSLTNFLAAMQAELNLGPQDRLLAVTTIAFDIAALELFAPLLAGARVVIAAREVIRDPSALGQLIQSAGITIMQATPSLWQNLVSSQGHVLRGLRVLVGGEALPSPLAQTLSQLGAGVTNLYGPTETTIWSTAHALGESDLEAPPIGRPIWNTQVYVLDASLQPVPARVIGNLYIAGAGVADGYLNRPGLTAERFIANPYGPPGSRFYRTGDLARWRPDGTLEFLGRTDHQIKIRGFRIEAGEVETAIMQCSSVERAIVMASDGPAGGKRLVAYLVPVAGAALDAAEIRRELTGRLPEYMIPAVFLTLDAFPVTANGKIDRKALPAPERQALSGYVAPRTYTEEKLAALWAVELGVERVGVHDNFFDLGGDSLMAARLVLEIEAAFSTEISLATLFEASTIADLAGHLEGNASRDPLGVLLPLRAQGNGAPLFCIHPVVGVSWAYAGMLRHIDPDHPVYALQARGLKGLETLPSSLEEMAANYLEEIRKVQPSGPYHLLGWSLGGLVAFAIARQLRLMSERVGFLALLDTYPFVQHEADNEPEETELVAAALGFLGYPPGALGDQPMRMATLADFLCREYDILSMPVVKQVQKNNHELIDSVLKVIENNLKLARQFSPGRVDADMLFFRATEGKQTALDSLLKHHADAWQPHVGGTISEYRIDCHHQHMMDPGPLDKIARIVASEFAARVRKLNSGAVQCE